jgi:tol-pal system protein YbgF
MTYSSLRALLAGALAVALLAGSAQAQSSGGLFDRIFGNNRPPASGQVAQAEASTLMVRIERLETQIRQLTGVVEQLQFRNQQLAEQLKRMQDDNEYRFQQLGSKGRPHHVPPPTQRLAPTAAPQLPSAPPPTKRSDIFDPRLHPDAPGAPKILGSVPSTPPAVIAANPAPQQPAPGEPPVGAPGGREAGAPLDLSTLSGIPNHPPAAGTAPAPGPGQLPPPPPRNTSATGAQLAAVEPPSKSPKDLYDLAYGYVLRKDYALAEQTFRRFIKTYPSDRRAPDAQYWLGESMFQRQRYRDAAEAFLTVSTKYETTGKAPDALMRLGQSLAALGEKEAACAALAEVHRKFPHASSGVKRGVAQEQKRAHC